MAGGGDNTVDRGAAFKRWVKEQWTPAVEKWRSLLPRVLVRVPEGKLQQPEGKLEENEEKLQRRCPIYLMQKRPGTDEEWTAAGLKLGPDDWVFICPRRDSKQAEAAGAVARACEASATVEIGSVTGKLPDPPRAHWDAVQAAHAKQLAGLLEEFPDPALLEQRDLADRMQELIDETLLDLAFERKQAEEEAAAERQRAAEEEAKVELIVEKTAAKFAELQAPGGKTKDSPPDLEPGELTLEQADGTLGRGSSRANLYRRFLSAGEEAKKSVGARQLSDGTWVFNREKLEDALGRKSTREKGG